MEFESRDVRSGAVVDALLQSESVQGFACCQHSLLLFGSSSDAGATQPSKTCGALESLLLQVPQQWIDLVTAVAEQQQLATRLEGRVGTTDQVTHPCRTLHRQIIADDDTLETEPLTQQLPQPERRDRACR